MGTEISDSDLQQLTRRAGELLLTLLQHHGVRAELLDEDLVLDEEHMRVRAIVFSARQQRVVIAGLTMRLWTDRLSEAPVEVMLSGIDETLEGALHKALSDWLHGVLEPVRVALGVINGEPPEPLTLHDARGNERNWLIFHGPTQIFGDRGLTQPLIGVVGGEWTPLRLLMPVVKKVASSSPALWHWLSLYCGRKRDDQRLFECRVDNNPWGAPEVPGRDPQVALLDHLGSREALMLLDNCEHVVDAAAGLATAVVQACPGVRVLATSREPLGVTGEASWRVPSLSVPGEGAGFAEVAESGAVRLFVERARLVRPAFALDAANVAAVQQVCRRLDGMPLAIELAAARLRVLSVSEIAARLDDRFALLTSGSRTALRRQQTLRAAVDWSHDLLAPQERALFRRLAVFTGGWTLAAAEGVCAGDGVAAEDVLDLLARLVDKSLVLVQDEVGTATRYRLLETLRQYALERLAESGEVERTGARHTEYCVAFTQAARPFQTSYRSVAYTDWLQLLQVEQSNLRSAMHRCVETRDVQRGLELGGVVCPLWQTQGSPSDGRDWLDQLLLLLKEGQAEPTSIRAMALHGAGVLATTLFDYTLAQTLLEESLAIRRQLGEPLAATLQALGSVAWRQGEYARADSIISDSVDRARAEGHRNIEGAALCRLGQVVEEVGDFVRASSLYSESHDVYRQLGDTGGMADAVGGQGRVAFALGDLRSAQASFQESLTLAREVNDAVTIAWGCLNLALVCLERGEWAKAGELFVENLHARGYLQDQRRIPRSLAGLAQIAAVAGNPERALRLFGAAMALREATRRPQRAWAAPPFDRASIERWEPAARDALGKEAAASAFAAGAALSLEEAVAYALEASGRA